MCKKFALKCKTNPRTEHWFRGRDAPRYARRTNTRYPKFIEPIARTDRYKNSPKNFLIRKLNEAE